MRRRFYRRLYDAVDLYQAPATLPAMTMLGFGVWLIMSHPFSQNQYQSMARLGNEWIWGIVCISISLLRLVLYRMDRVPPAWRALNTGLSALLWFAVTATVIVDKGWSFDMWLALHFFLFVLVDFLRWTGWVEYLEDRVQNG